MPSDEGYRKLVEMVECNEHQYFHPDCAQCTGELRAIGGPLYSANGRTMTPSQFARSNVEGSPPLPPEKDRKPLTIDNVLASPSPEPNWEALEDVVRRGLIRAAREPRGRCLIPPGPPLYQEFGQMPRHRPTIELSPNQRQQIKAAFERFMAGKRAVGGPRKRAPLCRQCLMQTDWVPEMQAYKCASPACGSLVTLEWLNRPGLRARARSLVREARRRLALRLSQLSFKVGDV